MLDTGGCGPFTNGRQLGRVCTDLAMANYVAQVIDLALKKCTFLHLCKHNWWVQRWVSMERRWCKCYLEVTTIHENIIKVYNYVLIEHVKEDLVHQPLKG